ncbi:DNL-type zinc finger protein isoform X6 [Grus americana]|nr:DNL-type zinc finger protein isoform X6 [Grus americana]
MADNLGWFSDLQGKSVDNLTPLSSRRPQAERHEGPLSHRDPEWEQGEELLCDLFSVRRGTHGDLRPLRQVTRAVADPRCSRHFCSPNQSQAPTSEQPRLVQSSLRCCTASRAQNELEAERERGEEKETAFTLTQLRGEEELLGWQRGGLRGIVVRSARDEGERCGHPG